MRILGIELAGHEMIGVVLQVDASGSSIINTSRLVLSATRDRSALVAFQSALTTVLNEALPERIGVKAKPETGRMQAGSAALKMEALLLASAKCDVKFIQTRAIEAAAATNSTVKSEHAYQITALAVALALSASNA